MEKSFLSTQNAESSSFRLSILPLTASSRRIGVPRSRQSPRSFLGNSCGGRASNRGVQIPHPRANANLELRPRVMRRRPAVSHPGVEEPVIGRGNGWRSHSNDVLGHPRLPRRGQHSPANRPPRPHAPLRRDPAPRSARRSLRKDNPRLPPRRTRARRRSSSSAPRAGPPSSWSSSRRS
jgi:hypothetical protein